MIIYRGSTSTSGQLKPLCIIEVFLFIKNMCATERCLVLQLLYKCCSAQIWKICIHSAYSWANNRLLLSINQSINLFHTFHKNNIPYSREKAPISSSSLPQITAYFGDKKFQLFGVLIDSSAAPWHTDSKYIYMSILNIIATEWKMWK